MQSKTDFEKLAETQNAKEAHNEEIKQSRVGGLGGSDADLVYRVGINGMSALTNTDMKRLAVMLGITEPDNFGGNEATNAGHDFEDYVDIHLIQYAEGVVNYQKEKPVPYERETKLSKKLAKNFGTFAHADFTIGKRTPAVIECKYVQATTDKVERTYMAQLQWYYLLGAKSVTLLHGWGAVPFNPEQLDYEMPAIERDEQFIAALVNGIKILDREIGDGWLPIIPEKASIENVPAKVREAFETLQRVKEQEDKLKEEKANAQAVLLPFMQDLCYTSILSETHTLTFTKATESREFDKAKFLKAHPEFDTDEWYKKSSRSASVSMKANKAPKGDNNNQ